MLSTCIFCHQPLGANQVIETFPVGRRLAFDAERGRLWVVCPRCERWNLSPLESRWEAIEDAERHYRSTRRRVATDNIALARLPEGLELVRIGQPLRPELAAWRYGDQFGRRRRRAALYAAGGAVALGTGVAAGMYAGMTVMTIGVLASTGQLLFNSVSPVVRISDGARAPLRVSRMDLVMSRLQLDDPAHPQLVLSARRWLLTTRGVRFQDLRSWPLSRHGQVEIEGEQALRALATLLPAINRRGARARTVEAAVQVVEREGAVSRVLKAGATTSLGLLPAPVRLALEMALHDDDERRAMSGELAQLYTRWEEAEHVARIADGLLRRDDDAEESVSDRD